MSDATRLAAYFEGHERSVKSQYRLPAWSLARRTDSRPPTDPLIIDGFGEFSDIRLGYELWAPRKYSEKQKCFDFAATVMVGDRRNYGLHSVSYSRVGVLRLQQQQILGHLP